VHAISKLRHLLPASLSLQMKESAKMCDENKTVCLRLIHISIPSQPDHSVTCQARRA